MNLNRRLRTLLRTRFPQLAHAIKARIVLLRKAVSFGLIGVINTAVDYAVFVVAVKLLENTAIDYSVLIAGVKLPGMHLVLSNVLSWSVAISGSYALNSFFTFAAESGRKLTWRRYVTFAASGILGLIANTTTLLVAAALLEPMLPSVNVYVAKLLSIGVSFVVNFSMSHFVVFRPRTRPASGSR
jgi:putative flippase GtrA